MSTRKLIVEVCNAHNLMPKDGQGTSSPYVVVDFDGQRRRTKTKVRDLNPQWNERLEFLVNDTESMAAELLEINVYNDKKNGKRSNFLGRLKLCGSSFVKQGAETLIYYALDKRSVFSQVKGELGLKIYYIDEEAAAAPPPEPSNKEEKAPDQTPPAEAPPAVRPAEVEEMPAKPTPVEQKAAAPVDDEKKSATETAPPEEKSSSPAEEKPPKEETKSPEPKTEGSGG